jgi:transposase
MSKIRQILRSYAQGKGTKAISSMLCVSRNTVKKYLQHFQTLAMSYEQALSLNDSELESLFESGKSGSSRPKSSRFEELQSLLPAYCKRLKGKGVTRQQLHQEYISTHPDGYGRSRFGTYIQCYAESSRPIMHPEHKAGDKLYIDFAGDKQYLPDKETGERVAVEVFAAILPCSQLTYVEAAGSQKKEDLIKSNGACTAIL